MTCWPIASTSGAAARPPCRPSRPASRGRGRRPRGRRSRPGDRAAGDRNTCRPAHGRAARARPAALDRQRRHRRLRHALAAPAGEGRPDMPDHLEAAGDVLQHLADVLADLAHRPAAGRAGAGRLVDHLGARQMFGQRPAATLDGRVPRLLLAVGRSDRPGRHRARRLQLLQHQLELLDRPLDLLRRPAELLAAQPGDLDLQLLDLQRLHHEPGPGRCQLRLARRPGFPFRRDVGRLCPKPPASPSDAVAAARNWRRHPNSWSVRSRAILQPAEPCGPTGPISTIRCFSSWLQRRRR